MNAVFPYWEINTEYLTGYVVFCCWYIWYLWLREIITPCIFKKSNKDEMLLLDDVSIDEINLYLWADNWFYWSNNVIEKRI